MTRPAATRVWIVEDEVSYRDTLSFLVGNVNGLLLGRTFGTAEDALAAAEQATAAEAPALVLMDVNLPGLNGIEATKRLRALLPDARVVVLTVRNDADTIYEALRAGASGYLPKWVPVDTLVSALQQARDGGMLIPPTVARRVLAYFQGGGAPPEAMGDGVPGGVPVPPRGGRGAAYGLTERERGVLRLMAEGLTQKEIAASLEITLSTVSKHVQRVYEKLHVNTLGGAVAKAIRERLV
ncbi:MAG TPA: response regulator [Rhodothermales bacterium]|nr:response regulator [Rhodothermales bacterium]